MLLIEEAAHFMVAPVLRSLSKAGAFMSALNIDIATASGSYRAGKFSQELRHLDVNGFAVITGLATADDLVLIRDAWQRVLKRADTTVRELGERTGAAPQIQEVQHITSHAPEIIET